MTYSVFGGQTVHHRTSWLLLHGESSLQDECGCLFKFLLAGVDGRVLQPWPLCSFVWWWIVQWWIVLVLQPCVHLCVVNHLMVNCPVVNCLSPTALCAFVWWWIVLVLQPCVHLCGGELPSGELSWLYGLVFICVMVNHLAVNCPVVNCPSPTALCSFVWWWTTRWWTVQWWIVLVLQPCVHGRNNTH